MRPITGLNLSIRPRSDRLIVKWVKRWLKSSESATGCQKWLFKFKRKQLKERRERGETLWFPCNADLEKLWGGHDVQSGGFYAQKAAGCVWFRITVTHWLCSFQGEIFFKESASLSLLFAAVLQDSRVAEIPCSRQGWFETKFYSLFLILGRNVISCVLLSPVMCLVFLSSCPECLDFSRFNNLILFPVSHKKKLGENWILKCTRPPTKKKKMHLHASLLLNYWTTGSKTINHNFMCYFVWI